MRVLPHVRATVVGVALALALVTVVSSCGSDAAGGPTDIAITAADGSEATLGDFAGTPLVANMWATWCGPCVEEMPAFDEVARERDDVTIVGINIGESAEDAAAFATDLGVSYPQFTDPDSALYDAFAVTSMPTTVFISADGEVLATHQGALTADELRDMIDRTFTGGS